MIPANTFHQWKKESCRYFKYPTAKTLTRVLFDTLCTIFPQVADGIVVEGTKRRDV